MPKLNKYSDTFLTNQPFFTQHYKNKKNYNEHLFSFLLKYNKTIIPNKEFYIEGIENFSITELATNPIIMNFHKFLIQFFNPKNVLEIGTFLGYSTLIFAKYSSKNTKISTIEKYKKFAEVAKKNFKKNNFSNKINLINEDANIALDVLIKKKKKFDYIFLDGDKGSYKELFIKIEYLMNKKSLVIVDNIFFQGDNINKKPITQKGKGVRKFVNYIKKNNKYKYCIIPMYDGILLLTKN
jgi:predicted O-methyltransferase YrrM